MASDEDYTAFLEKANQDTGASKLSSASGTAATKAVDTEVPEGLKKVEAYYVSDADEPFEPVSLKWKGKSLPSEKEFADLINHQADISTLDAEAFDPKNHYADVINSVKAAGGGQVRIFRAQQGKTRVEYYIVSLDAEHSRLVGLRAKAVES